MPLAAGQPHSIATRERPSLAGARACEQTKHFDSLWLLHKHSPALPCLFSSLHACGPGNARHRPPPSALAPSGLLLSKSAARAGSCWHSWRPMAPCLSAQTASNKERQTSGQGKQSLAMGSLFSPPLRFAAKNIRVACLRTLPLVWWAPFCTGQCGAHAESSAASRWVLGWPSSSRPP